MTAARAFDAHLMADVVRLFIVGAGVVAIMGCIRIAYLRVKGDSPNHPRTVLGLASYALFASIPTYESMTQFGRPLEDARTLVYLAALACGVAAAYADITLNPAIWRRHVEKARRRRNPDGR